MKPTSWLFVMNMLLASTVGWGQQPITFDTVRLNPLNSFLSGRSVFENDDGFVVLGTGGDGSGTVQSVRSVRFNEFGAFLSELEFASPRRMYLGMHDPVAHLTNGGFASGVGLFSGGEVIDSLHIYVFDEFGDTVWTKFLFADTTAAIRKCIETRNGDLLLVGLHEHPKGAFMFRTTSAGDSIRFKNFGAPAFYAMGVAEDEDENLFLAGYAETADINFNNNCYIIKCTPEGDVLWWRSKPRESWFTHVIAVDDGVVAMGYWRQNTFGESVAFTMKYSSTGDSLWQRNLQVADNIIEPCQLNDGFEDADGNLILCGTVENYNNVFNDKGLLYKLSPAGDVIWSRDYAHYGGQNGYHPQVFNALQPTRDGGFILTGETWGPSPPNPSRLWLLKLDSLGCLVAGCSTVGVQEFESQLQSALRLSPNPASDQLHVELPLPEGYRLEGAVQALLLDALGKEVLRNTIGNTGLGLSGNLDVSGLPSGLYFLHLRDGQKWLAGGKVVVE